MIARPEDVKIAFPQRNVWGLLALCSALHRQPTHVSCQEF